jgi:hypothetical protein
VRRFIITLVTLVICSMPVRAEEKVWYCEMTAYAELDLEGIDVRETNRFKFKVTPNEIVFGSDDNPFFGYRVPMWTYESVNEFEAADISVRVRFFSDGQIAGFSYTSSVGDFLRAIVAKCEDF